MELFNEFSVIQIKEEKMGTKEMSREMKKPFPLLFGECLESKDILHRGLEIYDDPTTVSSSGQYEDARSDEA